MSLKLFTFKMNSFLVLGFLLTVLAFSSGFYVKETASLPQPTTIRQKEPSKVLLVRPRARKTSKIERLVYLKNLMELRCLKKIFNNVRNKNRFRYLKPNNVIPLEITGIKNLKNQVSNQLRENFFNNQPQQVGNNRIIFFTPNNRFPERENNEFLKNKTLQWNLNEVLSNHSKFGISKISDEDKLVKNSEQTRPYVTGLQENYKNFSKLSTGNESIPRANISGNNFKLHQKLWDVKSTPGGSQNQSKPTQTLPQNVKNTNKEKPITDKNKEKFKSSHHGRKPAEKFFIDDDFTKRGHSEKINNLKTYSDVKEINNSIHTVLKSLMRSNDSSITKTKQIIFNSPSESGYLSTNSKTYLNNQPSVSDKGTIENRFFINRKEQSKQLKITIPNSEKNLQDSKKKLTETTTEKEENFNLTPTVKIENVSAISTTDVTKVTNATKSDLITEKNIYSWHSKAQTTAMPEIFTFESFNKVLEMKKNEEFDQTSFPVTITQDFTTEVKTVTEKENSTTTFSEIQTTLRQTTKEFVNENVINGDSPEKITEVVTKKMNDIETDTPEIELTPTFREFTDYPITFDLLTTIIKDQEDFEKNSRKMHFKTEIPTTTTTISNELEDLGQRRSDILIDENSDDYILDESSSGLNYIEEIKQNGSFLSSSPNYIIQLIPVVINDLREDKISSEEILILSNFFSDYWEKVVALSNKTDLDMLPLLKMKNEEDLNNILRLNFPEEPGTKDNETDETKYDNYTVYEYEDDYKNMNEDGSGEVFERGGRFKRNKENPKYFDWIKNFLSEKDEEQDEEERFILEQMNLKNVNLRSTNKVF